MKRLQIIVMLLFTTHYSLFTICQDLPANTQQQLEYLAGAEGAETEDDSWLQQMEQYRKHPIDINRVSEDELSGLSILSAIQVKNFCIYRELLGNFLSIYELQSILSWDLVTIRKILPYIYAGPGISEKEEIKKRFRSGEQQILFRASQVLERTSGYKGEGDARKYPGSPVHIFFRYRYQYKNLLQLGITGDKDAGELLFNGVQKAGFDFYSFHFFARKIGIIQSFALGDYTVNMGQGLIQWQSLAFKKSGEAISIKRQSPVLLPYHSAGEFNFFRGAGITIRKGKMEATSFFSLRKLSSNLVHDTISGSDFISSFSNTGYHRTAEENKDRNNLMQITFGGNINWKERNWKAGFNAVYYDFSNPLRKYPEPYNLYALSGRNWFNLGVDFDLTWRNMHLFGETAMDRNIHFAILNGIQLSVDRRVDISLLHRLISPAYQAVNGNAFTENTYPVNENGIYAGICIRFNPAIKFDAYADVFRFPWLKYRVDAPSFGKEFLMQLVYSPNKQTEIFTRLRSQLKQSNQSTNWRTQVSYRLNKTITLRNRVELVWYDQPEQMTERGFLFFSDLIYKPQLKPWSGIIRWQYFETDGYDSRVYAFENDVLYSFSIPANSGRGQRYYFVLNYDLGRRVSVWIRAAQSYFPGQSSIGEGMDQVLGARKTELKVQIRWIL